MHDHVRDELLVNCTVFFSGNYIVQGSAGVAIPNFKCGNKQGKVFLIEKYTFVMGVFLFRMIK